MFADSYSSTSSGNDESNQSVQIVVENIIRDISDVLHSEESAEVLRRTVALGKLCHLFYSARAEMHNEHRESLIEPSQSEFHNLCHAIDTEESQPFTDYLYRILFDRSEPFTEEVFLALYLLVLLAEDQVLDVDQQGWEALSQQTISDSNEQRQALRLCILSFLISDSDEQKKLVTKHVTARWLFIRLQKLAPKITNTPVKACKRGRDEVSPQDTPLPSLALYHGTNTKVVRGPQWCWGNQDGGERTVGDIVAVDPAREQVCVLWEGQARYYRYSVRPEYREVIPFDSDEPAPSSANPTLNPRDIDLRLEELHSIVTMISQVLDTDKDILSCVLQFNTADVLAHLLREPCDWTIALVLQTIKTLCSYRKFAIAMLERIQPDFIVYGLLGAVSNIVKFEAARLISSLFRYNYVNKAVSIWGEAAGSSPLVCHKNHPLELLNGPPDGYEGWVCDLCNRDIVDAQWGVLHCRKCKYDLCHSCQKPSIYLIVRVMTGFLRTHLPALYDEATNFLSHAFRFPVVMSAIESGMVVAPSEIIQDILRGITHMLEDEKLRRHLVSEDEKMRLTLVNVLLVYLQQHIIQAARPLWRKNRRLLSLFPRSKWDPLKTDDINSFLQSIEEALQDSTEGSASRDSFKKERLSCIEHLLNTNTHVTLLTLMASSRNVEIICSTGSFLALLAVVDFCRKPIASCQVPRETRGGHTVTSGIAVILSLFFLPSDSFPPERIIPLALDILYNVIRTDHITEGEISEDEDLVPLLRSHDGIRVLMSLLEACAKSDAIGTTKAASTLLKIYLELSKNQDVRHLLTSLSVRTLFVAIRELPGHPEVLLNKLLTMYQSTSVTDDPRLSRCEKQDIALRTTIRVDTGEVVDLVYSFLCQQGLHSSANALRQEAARNHLTDASLTNSCISLMDIVENHVRQQHTKCAHPISTLPVCSLRTPHRCPAKFSMENQLSKCISHRLGLQAVGMTTSAAFKHYDREQRYRNYSRSDTRNLATTIEEGDPTAACFLRDGVVIVGTNVGTLISFEGEVNRNAVELHVADDNDPDPDCEVVRLVDHPTEPIVAAGFHDFIVIKKHPFDEHTHYKIRKTDLTYGTQITQITGSAFGQLESNLFLATVNVRGQSSGAALYDFRAERLVREFFDSKAASTENALNRACLSMDDNLVLNDAVLWDKRAAIRPLHRYDKLVKQSSSLFHRNGCHVVIDIGVWDIRTHRLLRNATNFTEMTITMRSSDAIFAYNKSLVNVVDSRTYATLSHLNLRDRDPREEIADYAVSDYDTEIVMVTRRGGSSDEGHEAIILRNDVPYPQEEEDEDGSHRSDLSSVVDIDEDNGDDIGSEESDEFADVMDHLDSVPDEESTDST